MVRTSFIALAMLLGSSIPGLAASRLQVHVGATAAPGSSDLVASHGSVDFGAADVATVHPQTLTIRNTGTEPMVLLGRATVSRGFTVARGFGSRALAPGRSTTLVVAMNSAKAGHLIGQLSFAFRTGQTLDRVSIGLTGTAYGPPSMRIIANGDPGFRTAGHWTTVPSQAGRGNYQATVRGSGTNVATWSFTGLQPGTYRVATTWTPSSAHATNASFTVLNGSRPIRTVAVNQQATPQGLRDAGVTWQVLGHSFFITGHTLSVRLTDQADGNVTAGAVRIERVGFPGRIMNPGAKDFRSTHNLTATLANGGRSASLAVNPTTGGRVYWDFRALVPGQYRVSATWTPNSLAATNAAYTILDGSRALATVDVNQRQAPRNMYDAGHWWRDLGALGTLYSIRGDRLVVMLDLQSANGPVQVGSVRVERIFNPAGSTGPEGTSPADAVRFLEQSTWGPNDTEVQNVLRNGTYAYLMQQLQATYSGYPVLPLPFDSNDHAANHTCPSTLPPNDLAICNRDNYSLWPLQTAFFTNGMYSQDQLRQRMAYALHKIWVVSGADGNFNTIAARLSYYLQVLDQNALGNFNDVINGITLNPAMGNYLNMAGSKASAPNENYAREILQLFTVGLNLLNHDGTPQLDGSGNVIPTYSQLDIVAVARSFTGWKLSNPLMTGITNYRDPMIVSATVNDHDHNAKTFDLLGFPDVPAGLTAGAELPIVLSDIFGHQNVSPFISKSLIQQLTTSNPSPGYVDRVAQAFDNDGTGTRGNLQAVAFAILLDPEARGDVASDPVNFGKLREPAQYIANLMRLFNAGSYDLSTTSDGYLNPRIQPLGQDLLKPPTVFSYFLPSWSLPGSATLVGPEFQLLTNVTAYQRPNMVNTMFAPNSTNYGVAPTTPPNVVAPVGTRPDLSALMTLAPSDMADYLNGIMLHGTMSDTMRTDLINSISAVAASNPLKRAKTAVYLVATSPQYQVQQ